MLNFAIDKLANDEGFLERIISSDTPKEVQAAFKEKNVDIYASSPNKVKDGIASGFWKAMKFSHISQEAY